MAGRGQKLAEALRRRREAEQAQAQTPNVPSLPLPQATVPPPLPPSRSASRPASRPQTPLPPVSETGPALPSARVASRAVTPSIPSEATAKPSISASKPSSRPPTPQTGAMGPPPLPTSKSTSGRQTPSSGGTSYVSATSVIKPEPSTVTPSMGRGRAALLAKAKLGSGSPSAIEEKEVKPPLPLKEKMHRDNQSEMSFRSEDFETSSRKGAVVAVSDQLGSMKLKPSQPSAAQSTPSQRSSTPPVSKQIPQEYRGKGGKPFKATANYMQLRQKKDYGIFEYEVKFAPPVDNRDQRFKLVNQQRPLIGPAKSFDGNKLYVPVKFIDTEQTVDSVTASGLAVKITFKYKKQKESGDWDMIYILNNQFNKIMKTLKMVQHNRNHFDPAVAQKIPAYKMEVWPGFVTAVDQFEGGMLLQCDVVSRVVRTETVHDLLAAILKKQGAANLKTEAEKALIGQSALTRYNNRSYQIDDIEWKSSPMTTFTNHLGETMTFYDYYQRNYNLKIKDQQQPLLASRVKKKAHGQEAVETVINLVPELCLMTGLTDAMRADFKVMKEVGNFTRVGPQPRQDKLLTFIKRVRENPEAKAHLEEWGFELCPFTIPLEGRQLEPETLIFGQNKRERVNAKADWGRAATSNPVLSPIPITKWAIFFLDKNTQIVQSFVSCMQQQARKMGLNFAAPKPVKLPNDRTETYLAALKESIVPDAQLMVTVFPQMRSDRYAAVKKLCYVDNPVASQVINLKTISNEKKLASVAQKIALQINCKLGGELWACTTPFKNLMVVGIDVYHDKTSGGKSVAGVITSMNDSLSRYHSKTVIQQQGQEIVNSLTTAFNEGMIKYWEVNNRWPEHIVVFRDGVGDGQLETTAKHEAGQFIRAFQHITEEGQENGSGGHSPLHSHSNGNGNGHANGNGNGKRWSPKMEDNTTMLPSSYSPGFTFVVVQKRINTRILGVLEKAGKKEYENPPPGAIIDHTVTRFKYKDFFLVPQSVNQGTVSPTHFIVVRELGTEFPYREISTPTLSPTDVQKLAYKLTHMYYNWPGTVRVPAPVQYAHKLCDLVGQHIHREPSSNLNDKLYYL